MTGDELLRCLRRLARKRGVALIVKPGRGDHLKVWFGGKFTVLGGRSEMGRGLLHAILRDLGLTLDDLKG
jgi:hypothetical protein